MKLEDMISAVQKKLGVDVAVLSAEMLAMRNIELVLHRCHLENRRRSSDPAWESISFARPTRLARFALACRRRARRRA